MARFPAGLHDLLDRGDDAGADRVTAPVHAGPAGMTPAWIDLHQFDIRGHPRPVAHDAAQRAVHRSDHRCAVERAQLQAFIDPRADIERRVPDAVAVGVDEAFAAGAAEITGIAVRLLGRALRYDHAGLARVCLDRDIAVQP